MLMMRIVLVDGDFMAVRAVRIVWISGMKVDCRATHAWVTVFGR